MSTYHVDVLRKVLCVKKGPLWKILFSQISGRGRTRREERPKKGDGPYLKRKAGENGVVKLWRGREGRKDGEGFPSLFFKSPSTFFLNQNTESQSFLEHG